MPEAGASRRNITRRLHAAYAEGLLSEETLGRRLDLLLAPGLVDRSALIGDLTMRIPRRKLWERVLAAVRAPRRREPPLMLALDWSGGQEQLVIGRADDCDLVMSDLTVSRRHARLMFRDGAWIVHDLGSTNRTIVNRRPVQRCELRPGDRLDLGGVQLEID